MADLKIHGIAKSRAIRNIWLAEELGVPYDHVKVGWVDGGTKKPEFLAINPNASVPALEDGKLKLFESLAINLYLAKKHGKGLYPSSLEDEARTWQWTLWVATEVERHIGAYGMHSWGYAPEKRDAKVAAEARKALDKPMAVLDQHLGKQPYLLGQSFTVADLNIAGVFFSPYVMKFDFSPWPNVKAWIDRCFGRKAAQKTMEIRAAS
ncbi:MAG: glutathione S-transferase family protein [Alphaproteobacteria bacterium]|nr:glutathione S-transferase family protein [Alphaproteobacteria bacterium]